MEFGIKRTPRAQFMELEHRLGQLLLPQSLNVIPPDQGWPGCTARGGLCGQLLVHTLLGT